MSGSTTSGATALLETAAAAGVDVCFANPGTTEMPLVAALDAVPQVRAVLGLFEGVCTGAADGYARLLGRPALTLLHLGPGFANGIANLHNARRARSPIVNLIGDQTSWHLAADAPLTSDIESLAQAVSGWVRTAASAEALPSDIADAIAAATGPPGSIASYILPADYQSQDINANPVAVFLSEEGHGSLLDGLILVHLVDLHRQVRPHLLVDKLLGLLELPGLDAAEVGDIKAQARGIDQ